MASYNSWLPSGTAILLLAPIFKARGGESDLGQFESYMAVPTPMPVSMGLGSMAVPTWNRRLLFTQSLWPGRKGSVKDSNIH